MIPRALRKKWIMRGAMLLALLAVAGFLVAASGIVPIKASSRHWAITRWFLNFAKERSVATHSLGIKPPALDVEWRVLKGAGHFEVGCRPCHGSPDMPQPRIAHAMTPNPPPLETEVTDWSPAELFYIVKHGIKFTGMPAWPAKHRDDEIWAIVAFLQKLPGLDGPSYRRWVDGDADSSQGAAEEDLLPPRDIPDVVHQNCARCHGADGNGRGTGAFPKLAGQKPEYLYESLAAYARGNRHSGIMEPIAAGLDEGTMRDLARYYSSLIPDHPAEVDEHASRERGRQIAETGIPAQAVAACSACHGPSPTRRNRLYPSLAGQYPEYLVLQLELFANQARGGTEFSHLMHFTASGLTPEQRRDVALHYAALNRDDAVRTANERQ